MHAVFFVTDYFVCWDGHIESFAEINKAKSLNTQQIVIIDIKTSLGLYFYENRKQTTSVNHFLDNLYIKARNFLHTWRENISTYKALVSVIISYLLWLSDPTFTFLFNIGCIGRHVTWVLSAHVTMTSEMFYFKMAKQLQCFFNVNVMKIKHRHIKVCKK